ncbi:dihydrolipoyllysine-residue succinyltransferase component of 2-oxoglutarate dehydrogenase complex, mitochondrial [Anopheles arabiensis]|uniref:Dihydrolipoyllysine-residue succinyltransferase component of 2-oxoglutarate dehydrogenase complex, mitochondrial n=3 Tax=gambiae species complex TaxID=44542 RepID=A0A6E8VHZ5_ANOCL|nr:dihydrolipoyllysine-residue succinyltransferase component of 2-oxoglutarate dehydrogenase complex, mitochondrial [Anopheles arabiensis]XP_040220335.2 dihydrolipoyllysine-residue succinyltransferase component of 2-oxoglutarate dehydrogenase complex, mitochondrial [Anopheles coluzzii]XP_041762004.1 dihydrolipoyllysine-residue succinyltransferase component of 2-oxoglutarate dehydrogenase complex, mitochondrial [Anopheles merus]XP_309608.5 dihydrolipoyllysine-residue succinyltransferase component
MAGILSISSRNLPRAALRLGLRSLEGQSAPQQGTVTGSRSYHQGRRLLPSVAVRSAVTDSGRRCESVRNSIKAQGWAVNERAIFTSARMLSSEIVKVPPFADSVSEGDVKFEKKVGDAVAADEVVMEIETDKTTVGVPAPGHGIIEEIYVADGDTVKAGQQLFKLKITGEAPKASAAKPADAPAPAAAAPPPPPPPPPVAAAAPPPPPPAAAAGTPPPPPPPKPAAPISRMPVAAIRHAQAIEAATVKVPPADYTKEITGTRTEQRVKMTRMRLKIASRLKEAQNTNAMLTTFNEIDMSFIMDFRKQHLEAFQKKYGMKLGFMSAFCKAAAYALQDQPVVNAVIDENEIIYRDYVDISVAVASPKGLVVPVLRNVEGMNYADIELAIAGLADKAKKGTLAVEDMDGGTFTISNGGVFGSLLGTPIINPPQSAILGMHGIFERPIAVKGQVVIRPMMYVALTYDHRLIDGREAVTFLRKVKAAVEDPRIVLAGL